MENFSNTKTDVERDFYVSHIAIFKSQLSHDYFPSQIFHLLHFYASFSISKHFTFVHWIKYTWVNMLHFLVPSSLMFSSPFHLLIEHFRTTLKSILCDLCRVYFKNKKDFELNLRMRECKSTWRFYYKSIKINVSEILTNHT